MRTSVDQQMDSARGKTQLVTVFTVQSLRAQANLFTDRKLWLLETYSMNKIEHFMLFLYDNILGSEQGRKSK